MFKRFANFIIIIAMLALASPVFAKSFSQTIDISQPATIGQQSLQPGQYKFTANLSSDMVRIERDGKLVATVQGKTVDLKNKAPYGALVFNGRRIEQIQFQGKMQAIEIPNS
ncbi:MAG TPA: hypothetical protein VFU57_09155 [Candidatus Acidoferrales bacterium]|nr:hypothetical protein [Candidatus Acidoferrales bacterium]